MQPADPLEAGLMLARALEAHGVPYALGGALAYGIWGIPRDTLDVDVNVFSEGDQLADVAAALSTLGVAVNVEQVKRDSADRGLRSYPRKKNSQSRTTTPSGTPAK